MSASTDTNRPPTGTSNWLLTARGTRGFSLSTVQCGGTDPSASQDARARLAPDAG